MEMCGAIGPDGLMCTLNAHETGMHEIDHGDGTSTAWRGDYTVSANDPILSEADRIIAGEREGQYGAAEDSFTVIAGMWNQYLYRKLVDNTWGQLISSRDVAMMMILLKVARETHSGKRDNLVDIAGYAALAERCE